VASENNTVHNKLDKRTNKTAHARDASPGFDPHSYAAATRPTSSPKAACPSP
jgi:hypothetical protein